MISNLTNMSLNERIHVNYDITNQQFIMNQKVIVIKQIENKGITKESVINDNQEECSLSIVSNLHNKKIINIMVLALTQSGKTGTMVGLIKNYLNDSRNLIPTEHMYIITGLSSCEWKDQTINRIPEAIKKRVYHRDNLTNEFADDIKNKKNVLIIIDEIQIAAKENQTLHKAFKKVGFYDKQTLLKNDIKIVEFTATPDGTIYDLMNWKDNALKIKMNPGNGYTSCFDLKNQKRVFQYKDLCGCDKKTGDVNEEIVANNILELKMHIDKYEEPLYHIIRTPPGSMANKVINNFKEFIGENIEYNKYDKDSDIKDINNILKTKPKTHTYIFIKEKLRCAKTLIKTYLGVVYERYIKSPDDTIVIQGLIGRGTGYDDNGISKYFINIESIEKYEKLWNSNFEDKSVKWKSKTTKRKNDLLHSTGTCNNPSLFKGMNAISEEIKEEHEPIIKKFKTQEEVKQYFNLELKPKFGGSGPRMRIPSNGYYTINIGNGAKPCSTQEIHNVRKLWLTSTPDAKYRVYPCYENINDKSTLQFWIIHY